MGVPLHKFRAVVATGVSLWMALLACLMGCTVPALASSRDHLAPSVHQRSAQQQQPDLMADMPSCPHHSTGTVPAKQKPVGGRMSCCPVEVTLASKPQPVTLHVALTTHPLLIEDFTPATVRVFHATEFAPLLQHNGRDTLLQTQLLRI